MNTEDVFRRVTTAFEQIQIPYMLTGSFASAYHGEPRATQDIDLVIDATVEQVRKLADILPSSAYYFDIDDAVDSVKRQSMFNIIDLATGWKVDLILLKRSPFELEKFRRRLQVDYNGISLFIATAEDIVVSKLEWSRAGESERQLRDVAGILKIRSDLDRTYIEHWVKTLDLAAQWAAARTLAGQ